MDRSSKQSRFLRGSGFWLAVLALVAASLASGTKARSAPRSGPAGGIQRLVFAYYYYAYQGDPRKPVPPQGIHNAKGLTTLTDHPWESSGPWMSYDRAQWHKNQFQLMAAGGIDVVLPIYRGDRASRRTYALKGLDVMTQGLKELRSEGLAPLTRAREYPQIGLCLDLGGLADEYGGPVDLKSPDVQRSFYGMVRDFFLHVPEEFRATVQLPATRLEDMPLAETGAPNGTAYVVRLIGDTAVKDGDNSALTYVEKRFAKEFGTRLVWVGTPGLRSKINGFDAVAPFPAATRSASIGSEGWIRTGSFGPGYDASGSGSDEAIRSRDNGQQVLTDFNKIMKSGADWVFIDSWNGYANGTDIAPTLEYGLLYRDLIRGGIIQFKGTADYAATFVRASAPRVVEPGRIYQVEVAVQNSGTADWDVLSATSLSYRWLKDGNYVKDPGATVSSPGQIHSETRTFLVGITQPTDEGKPLPPGQYELELNMNHRVGKDLVWFDAEGTAPLRIPVTVGKPQTARPSWVSSTLTEMAEQGASYPAHLRLRNDGTDTWKKGTYSLGYRWRKIATYLKGGKDEDEVVAEGPRVPLEADVAPGRMITVEAQVAAKDSSGKPLPTWSAKDDWCYVLEWDLYDGSRYAGAQGGATYREPIEVVDRDPAPSFLGCNLLNQLVAGRTEKITVGLRNSGPEEWKKGRDKVIVHWYYMDGTEASWNDAALPLDVDVPPFSETTVEVQDDVAILPGGVEDKKDDKKKKSEPKEEDKKEFIRKDKKGNKHRYHLEKVVRDVILRDVPVTVPYYFGPMYCVFDFQHDGLFASSSSASRGNDLLVIPVNVFSPTFTPQPLNAYFNVAGISQDVDRGEGNIDGRGNSLPAEFMPPYVPRPSVGGDTSGMPLYPSGLWVRPLNAFESKRVCFLYPGKQNKVPNMIACEGQRILLGPQSRTGVHVLALSTDEDKSGDFTLTYSDGTSVKKHFTFTHWNDPPKHGEQVAFATPHRHTAAGDDPSTRCYVNQYSIPADPLKTLVSVELPRQPALKVMAITLETAGLKAN